jgi:predicted dehydrogenase
MSTARGSDKTVRFAVVGAGHMGGNHIKKIRSLGSRIDARVSAIIEPDELRATALAREFPESERPRILANLGQLGQLPAADYPDAAVVAVPASIHVETAAACLAKGLHCLVEKPLGFSALDCQELSQQAARAKKVLHVGMLERWSMANLWRDWRPTQGPWTINAVRVGPFVPRVGDTDVLHDLMIHDIDLFVLLDSVYGFAPVKTVRAWGRKLRSGFLDYAIVALDLEDGGMARFFASRLSAESARSWEMTGPDWHASLDFMRRTLKRFERVGRDMNAFQAFETQWQSGDPLGLEIEAFVQQIRGTLGTPAAGATSFVAQNFASLDKFVPTPKSVARSHEILDEVLSCIKVLD